jgi:hypothetical protein
MCAVDIQYSQTARRRRRKTDVKGVDEMAKTWKEFCKVSY